MQVQRKTAGAVRVMLVAAFSTGLLTFALCAAGNERGGTSQGGDTFTNVFMPLSSAVLNGTGQELENYLDLQTEYHNLDGERRRHAAQLISMADSIYGRYEDAAAIFRKAFPRKTLTCPQVAQELPALEALPEVFRRSDVVLLNESHSLSATRALLYQLLPVLRNSGYEYLALEALFPKDDSVGASSVGKEMSDPSVAERGYPVDDGVAGPYLRDPVFGEIIRRSLQLGFKLIAYDAAVSTSRASREAEQARALSHVLEHKSGGKLAVFAGYDHIRQTDGWMGELLAQKNDLSITSIDLVSGLGGCVKADGTDHEGKHPYVFPDSLSEGGLWSASRGIDITVLHDLSDARWDESSWLTMGGERQAVAVPSSACELQSPCLVEAYYASESMSAVPADRYVVTGDHASAILYLRPGEYRLETSTLGMARRSTALIVDR